MEEHYFFFSYARADDDGYVEKFYRDLVTEVRRVGGLQGERVGFRDNASMAPGSLWRDELADALIQARTFVALCSPSY